MRWIWVVMAVSAVVLPACKQNTVANACGRACLEGEICSVELGKCVQNQPPAIRVDLPFTAARIATESFHLVGLVTDDENSWVDPKVSVDEGTTWAPLGVNAGGDFDQVLAAPLVDGVNATVRIEVADDRGAVGRASVPVVFDRVAPRCRVVSPVAGTLLGGVEADFVFEVTDDSLVYGPAGVSLDNGLTWLEQPVMAGRTTFAVPLPQGVERPLALTFRGADAAGNACTVQASFDVDTAGPVITERVPVANAVIARQPAGTFVVEFTVADGHQVASAEVLVPPSPSWQPAPVQNGVASFTWTLPAGDDGTARVVQLRATDSVGNVTTHPVPVTVDVLSPSCVLTSPTNGQQFTGAGPLVTTVRWHVSDGSQSFGVSEVSMDDGTTWTQVATATNGDAEFAWGFDPAWDGVTRTVRVRGADAAGNRCVERSAQVTVDVVGPTLGVTSPSNGAVVGTATLQFQGPVSDGSGPAASVTLDFADGVGPRNATVGATTWTLVVPASATDDYRAHAVSIRALDLAGNETLKSWRVVVDRVAPQLSVLAPTEGQLFGAAQLTGGSTVAVQLQATDGDTNLVVEEQDGTGWQPVTTGAFAAATSVTDDGASYSQQVRARDTAGNTTSLTRSYRVDRVAPVVVSTAPANGALANSNSFSMQFSEAVQVQGTSVPVTFTPAVPVAATFSLDGTLRVLTVAGLLGNQAYSATAINGRVSDLAGNPAIVGSAVAFQTRPARPVSGAVLIASTPTQQVEWFRSSVDSDGVIALVVRVVNPVTSARAWLLGWVDPRTGLWAQQDVLPAADTGASLISWAETVAGARQRRASAWLGDGETGAMFTLGTAGSVSAPYLLAPQLATGELAGSDYGTFGPSGSYTAYTRAPNPPELIFTNPISNVGFFSGDSWGLAQVAAGGSAVTDVVRSCDCSTLPCTCAFNGRTPLTTIDVDCSSGTCVPDCSPSFAKYLRTSSASYYFGFNCGPGGVIYGPKATAWQDRTTAGMPATHDLQPVMPGSYGVAATGTGNTLLVATSLNLNGVGIALGLADPTSSLSFMTPVKTITVEALAPFKPDANPYLNEPRFIFEPLPGQIPAVLYVASPGRLMYRE